MHSHILKKAALSTAKGSASGFRSNRQKSRMGRRGQTAFRRVVISLGKEAAVRFFESVLFGEDAAQARFCFKKMSDVQREECFISVPPRHRLKAFVCKIIPKRSVKSISDSF